MSSIDAVNKLKPSIDPTNGEAAEETSDAEELNGRRRDAEKGTAALSLDTVFDLLKNQRRRRVLQYLREEQEATLSDLAEHIAALENQKEVALLSSSERKRVYVGLYQCHLPRMDDADVVDFNADRGTIKLTERAAQLERHLDVTGRRWPLYYAGIAFVGAGAYALSLFALETTVLSSITLVLIIVAISICAFFHHRSDNRYDDL